MRTHSYSRYYQCESILQINETDTRKYCFLPAASTVPRTVLTTTNALSLKGCYVPCALNANVSMTDSIPRLRSFFFTKRCSP